MLRRPRARCAQEKNILSTRTRTQSAALALCFSAAEYAHPVWKRSTHEKKSITALNTFCRQITCLRPTSTDNLYTLAEIVSPDIIMPVLPAWKKTCSQIEYIRHSLVYNQVLAAYQLASRKSFLKSVEPSSTSTSESIRVTSWKRRLSDISPCSYTNDTQPLWRVFSWSRAYHTACTQVSFVGASMHSWRLLSLSRNGETAFNILWI